MSEMWSKMYIGLHVKYPLFFSDFNGTWISRQIFEKSSNMKFHDNPSIGSRVVPCERTEMTKLIVAIRNFANATKNCAVTVLRTTIISRELGIRKAIVVSGFKRVHFHFNNNRIVIRHTVLGNSGFHMRNNCFVICPQFGHVSSKRFASLVPNRISLKNIGLRKRPHFSGRTWPPWRPITAQRPAYPTSCARAHLQYRHVCVKNTVHAATTVDVIKAEQMAPDDISGQLPLCFHRTESRSTLPLLQSHFRGHVTDKDFLYLVHEYSEIGCGMSIWWSTNWATLDDDNMGDKTAAGTR